MLIALSVVFLFSINPMLRRQKWLFGKQSEVTSSLVARERLRSALGGVLLVRPTVPPLLASDGGRVLLEFFRPRSVTTSSFGTVPDVDLREMAVFDRDRRFQLVFDGEGNLRESDRPETFRRLIWALGPQSQLEVEISEDLRRVDLLAQGVNSPGRPEQSTWKH